MHGSCSLLRRWAAPTGQKVRLAALCKLQRSNQRIGEIVIEELALESASQKVRPQEFTERRRVLGETAALAQFACQTAKRIVHQRRDPLRHILITAPTAALIEGVQPTA